MIKHGVNCRCLGERMCMFKTRSMLKKMGLIVEPLRRIKPFRIKKAKWSAQRDKRTERMRLNGGSHTLGEWNRLLDDVDHKCVCCGCKVALQRDHIKPISKGGTDDIYNLQPLCWPCNRKKNALHQTRYELVQ